MKYYLGNNINESGILEPTKSKSRKKKGKLARAKRKLRKNRKYRNIPQIEIEGSAEIEAILKEKDRLLKEELAKLDPKRAPTKQDSSFYPAPKNLEKRRCYFHKGAKALKCTVCSGGKKCTMIL